MRKTPVAFIAAMLCLGLAGESVGQITWREIAQEAAATSEAAGPVVEEYLGPLNSHPVGKCVCICAGLLAADILAGYATGKVWASHRREQQARRFLCELRHPLTDAEMRRLRQWAAGGSIMSVPTKRGLGVPHAPTVEDVRPYLDQFHDAPVGLLVFPAASCSRLPDPPGQPGPSASSAVPQPSDSTSANEHAAGTGLPTLVVTDFSGTLMEPGGSENDARQVLLELVEREDVVGVVIVSAGAGIPNVAPTSFLPDMELWMRINHKDPAHVDVQRKPPDVGSLVALARQANARQILVFEDNRAQLDLLTAGLRNVSSRTGLTVIGVLTSPDRFLGDVDSRVRPK